MRHTFSLCDLWARRQTQRGGVPQRRCFFFSVFLGLLLVGFKLVLGHLRSTSAITPHSSSLSLSLSLSISFFFSLSLSIFFFFFFLSLSLSLSPHPPLPLLPSLPAQSLFELQFWSLYLMVSRCGASCGNSNVMTLGCMCTHHDSKDPSVLKI